MTRQGLSISLLMVWAAMAGGCGVTAPWRNQAGGELTLSSVVDPATRMVGRFDTAYYSFDDVNHMTVLLIEGPVENPTQAVTIRMFWTPRAARTPISTAATNATIHYMIFTGEDSNQVGIYSGAGFMFPHGKLGDAKLKASIWDANLSLSDQTAGFRDLLLKAALTGTFTVQRDDLALSQTLHQLRTMLRERLGYPRLVAGDTHSASAFLYR